MAEQKSDGDGAYAVIMADDGSLPAKTDDEKAAMLQQRKEFEMDYYYDIIKEYTYQTRFISVSFEEAEALRLYLRGTLKDNTKDNEIFIELKNKLSKCLNEFYDCDNYFIRMSTRSPKDACDKPIFRKKLIGLMKTYFCNNNGILNNELYNDKNSLLIGLRECFSKVLSVKTINSMLDLLSYSERCVSDLKRLVDHKHLLKKWDLYLVIREFKFIPICNEFRCFVFNNKMTGISQYFPHCLFKNVVNNKTQLRQLIIDFFQNIVLKEFKFPFNDYVLDLNVDINDKTVTIIELNPFSRTTGSGFFDWKKDEDLLYGKMENIDYPELRIREEVDIHLKVVLSQWKSILIEFDNELKVNKDESNECCVIL